jgi:hypothetical protein
MKQRKYTASVGSNNRLMPDELSGVDVPARQ